MPVPDGSPYETKLCAASEDTAWHIQSAASPMEHAQVLTKECDDTAVSRLDTFQRQAVLWASLPCSSVNFVHRDECR